VLGSMTRRIAASALILLVASACANAASPGGGAIATPTTIVLNPATGNTFVLAPDAPAKLTAAEALAVFTAKDTEFTGSLSDALAVDLGYYTAPVGDGTYRWKDRLAWGYNWDQVMPWPGLVQPTYSYTPPHLFWLFLDANTGEMLEATWQNDAP
jgi:hypothetical protein